MKKSELKQIIKEVIKENRFQMFNPESKDKPVRYNVHILLSPLHTNPVELDIDISKKEDENRADLEKIIFSKAKAKIQELLEKTAQLEYFRRI